MAELLDAAPDLDAVFACSDLMANGALRTLRARGRRVPDDVAVVGYDDLEPAAWADPPLTTVRQDVEEMGRLMARLLLRLLDPRTDAGTGRTRPVITEAGWWCGIGVGLAPVITQARLVVRESASAAGRSPGREAPDSGLRVPFHAMGPEAKIEAEITVRRALELPALRRGLPEVLAGEDRLDRAVRWVHAGEVPHIASLLKGGELLLTTGLGLSSRPTEQRAFIRKLADREIAALVVELGSRFESLPSATGRQPHGTAASR